jgi:hypothetical protein
MPFLILYREVGVNFDVETQIDCELEQTVMESRDFVLNYALMPTELR